MEAEREGWLGEIAGLEATTLAAAEQKLNVTHLGMPDFRNTVGRVSAES